MLAVWDAAQHEPARRPRFHGGLRQIPAKDGTWTIFPRGAWSPKDGATWQKELGVLCDALPDGIGRPEAVILAAALLTDHVLSEVVNLISMFSGASRQDLSVDLERLTVAQEAGEVPGLVSELQNVRLQLADAGWTPSLS